MRQRARAGGRAEEERVQVRDEAVDPGAMRGEHEGQRRERTEHEKWIARSTAISLAPSLVNSSEAARPMPLPAPVMMTDLPSRRPMRFSLFSYDSSACDLSACRHTEFSDVT